MKESELYLRFLKSHILYFAIFGFSFSLVGGIIQFERPAQYELIRLFQIQDKGPIQDQITHVQETVSSVRTLNVQQHFGVVSQITVYNSSPLNITLQVVSPDGISLQKDSEGLTQYMESMFVYKHIGNDITKVIKPNIWAGILVGFIVGCLIELIGLLVFNYFKHY